MKITKKILENMIKEELSKVIKEETAGPWFRNTAMAKANRGGKMSARDVLEKMPIDRLKKSVATLFIKAAGIPGGYEHIVHTLIADDDEYEQREMLIHAMESLRYDTGRGTKTTVWPGTGGDETAAGGAYNFEEGRKPRNRRKRR